MQVCQYDGVGVDDFCNFIRSLSQSLDIFSHGVGVLKEFTVSNSGVALSAVQALKFTTNYAARFSYGVTMQAWCFASR